MDERGLPPHAILAHIWLAGNDEVNFIDLDDDRGWDKDGYEKIQSCSEQARRDRFEYFWVDTCCINKANHSELSESIILIFK